MEVTITFDQTYKNHVGQLVENSNKLFEALKYGQETGYTPAEARRAGETLRNYIAEYWNLMNNAIPADILAKFDQIMRQYNYIIQN